MCLQRSGKEYGFYCLHILSKVVKKVNVYIFLNQLLSPTPRMLDSTKIVYIDCLHHSLIVKFFCHCDEVIAIEIF